MQSEQQATLFADLPVDATASEAQAALASLRARVAARLPALCAEMRHLGPIAEGGPALLSDDDLVAVHSNAVELVRRLGVEIRHRHPDQPLTNQARRE